MLNVDDIRSIPLFSTLADAELERLAQTSADLHLGAGEFAVHEGGERALYAVLAGKIEVVKMFDGIERTLGWRAAGHDFRRGADRARHAVPGRLPGGGAVARDARRSAGSITRLRRRRPEIAAKIGALARERIGGLQGIAAEPPKARVDDGRPSLGHRLQRACAGFSRATRSPSTG